MERLVSASPCIARYLREDRLSGTTDKALATWGGAIASRSQIEGVLPMIDGVIVLLELAGYEVQALALAVPKKKPVQKAQANTDAVWLELPWLVASRGVGPTWPEPPVNGPQGRVGLWVRPRRGRVPGGGWLDGCAMDLRAYVSAFAALRIGVGFTTEDSGWFTLLVEPSGWASSVSLACETACTELSGILGDRARAQASDSLLRPGCGLLGLLDPASWQLGAPDWGVVRDLPSVCEARDLAAEIYEQFCTDPTRFVLQDTGHSPLTALERIGLLDAKDRPARWWAGLIDDLGGIHGSVAGLGDLSPAHAAVLSWTHMLLWMHEIGTLDALEAIAASLPSLHAPAIAYGGYALRSGDKDSKQRWGGRVVGPEDRKPAPGDIGYVRQLQLDLLDVGIRLQTNDHGEFDESTEWALREFEIATRFATAARPRTDAATDAILPQDTLEPVAIPPESRLSGPITGLLDARLAETLQLWISRGWRHPVVLYALGPKASSPALVNIWSAADVQKNTYRFWAWDVSGQFSVAPPRTPPYYMGKYIKSGPANFELKPLWDEMKISPMLLLGEPLAAEAEGETSARPSTYRVLAAVAEVEMAGRFDALNAWDGAFISLGLYHWTLGLRSGPGELGALFSLLREKDPAAFEEALGRYGVRPTIEWGATGEALKDPSTRTYVSHVSLRGVDGQWMPVAKKASKYWFRCWSWFYRMQMACRTIEGLRRIMWDLGRLRIRDVLDMTLGAEGRSLREMFTSERTVAMLIRWHVNVPATLRSSSLAARLPAGDPSGWDEEELAGIILDAIVALKKLTKDAHDNLISSTTVVRDNETLSTANNSFRFDDSGL